MSVYINSVANMVGGPHRLGGKKQLELEEPKDDDTVFRDIYRYLQSLDEGKRLELIERIKSWSQYFNGNDLTPDEQCSKERMGKVYFPVITNAVFLENADFFSALRSYNVNAGELEGDLLELVQKVSSTTIV